MKVDTCTVDWLPDRMWAMSHVGTRRRAGAGGARRSITNMSGRMCLCVQSHDSLRHKHTSSAALPHLHTPTCSDLCSCCLAAHGAPAGPAAAAPPSVGLLRLLVSLAVYELFMSPYARLLQDSIYVVLVPSTVRHAMASWLCCHCTLTECGTSPVRAARRRRSIPDLSHQ